MNIDKLISFIRQIYNTEGQINLHSPSFSSIEEDYILDCLRSSFVSNIGFYVGEFERRIKNYTGAKYSLALINGTSALQLGLRVLGVKKGDLVITQALTFIATCNAIKYLGADPIFCDVSTKTLGLSYENVKKFLENNAILKNGECFHKISNRKIKAILPMHTFGHAAEIENFKILCQEWNLKLIEDAAESLGSFFGERHLGTIGDIGILSFNGNKIITTGGGGMLLTDNKDLFDNAKHLASSAKLDSTFEFLHDEIGYNFRLPALNAALGCGQISKIDNLLNKKRKISELYSKFFKSESIIFFQEQKNCKSNYWLNCIICHDKKMRDEILIKTNQSKIQTRGIWKPMNYLPMYKKCISSELINTNYLYERVVNLPSSPNVEL